MKRDIDRRTSVGAPPSELSRIVQPVLQSLPSGTKFETNMIFVLDATASYYRDLRRE